MNWWGNIAHISVLLFFFLSGFVIFFSLDSRFKKAAKIDIPFFKGYFKSRFLRIYPPLIGVFCLIIILKLIVKAYYRVLPNEFMFSYQDLLSYLLMFKVSLGLINAPLWSLIIEWWFYFLGFLIFYFSKKKFLNKIFGLILIYLVLIKFLVSLNSNIVTYFLFWISGSLYYYFKLHYYRKVFMYISITSFIYTFFFINILGKEIDLEHDFIVHFMVIFSFVGFIFYFPPNKILVFLSKFSYSIYIIHYPIFVFIKLFFFKEKIESWGLIFLIFIFTLMFSYLFSLIFENKTFFKTIK